MAKVKMVKCFLCDGKGTISAEKETYVCDMCFGSGKIPKVVSTYRINRERISEKERKKEMKYKYHRAR